MKLLCINREQIALFTARVIEQTGVDGARPKRRPSPTRSFTQILKGVAGA
jgi:hypothetical protein